MATEIRRITPVLVVDRIEPSLRFWTERMGYTVTAEVPHGDALGFVMLEKDGTELMYQTRDSVLADIPALADGMGSASLFIEVADVDAAEAAVQGMPVLVPRRTTFYGMDEIAIREPGGHAVVFAQRKE